VDRVLWWLIVLVLGIILGVILLGCGGGGSTTNNENIFKEPDFIKGMTYAGFSRDVFLTQASDIAINNLSKTGVNWVAIVVTWYQSSATSTTIFADDWSVSDEAINHLIDYIHSLGMKVMLKPHVDSKDGTWRGAFNPTSWDEWFASYTQFILHYAQIAQNKNVEMFSVGCEYVSSDATQDKKWKEVIAEIKKHYTGKLTYSACWRNGAYKNVSFWDLLDYIGIDAYFPVADKNDATVDEMKEGWQKWIAEIESWRKNNNITKPIIFTEIGVCSYDGAAKSPENYVGTTPDWGEQADYYKAFFETFINKKWLKGVFWFWWDNSSTADYINGGQTYQILYTPQGKPAEEVLKEYFR